MNKEDLLISRLKSHLLDCSILKEEHKKSLEHYREMEMKIKAEQDLQSDEAFNKELFELQFKINALSLHMTYSSFAIIELNRILRLLGKEVLFDNQEMEDLFLDIIKGLLLKDMSIKVITALSYVSTGLYCRGCSILYGVTG